MNESCHPAREWKKAGWCRILKREIQGEREREREGQRDGEEVGESAVESGRERERGRESGGESDGKREITLEGAGARERDGTHARMTNNEKYTRERIHTTT